MVMFSNINRCFHFEVFIAVSVQIVVFWVVTSSDLVGGCHCLEECCASIFRVEVCRVRNELVYVRLPLRSTSAGDKIELGGVSRNSEQENVHFQGHTIIVTGGKLKMGSEKTAFFSRSWVEEYCFRRK